MGGVEQGCGVVAYGGSGLREDGRAGLPTYTVMGPTGRPCVKKIVSRSASKWNEKLPKSRHKKHQTNEQKMMQKWKNKKVLGKS